MNDINVTISNWVTVEEQQSVIEVNTQESTIDVVFQTNQINVTVPQNTIEVTFGWSVAVPTSTSSPPIAIGAWNYTITTDDITWELNKFVKTWITSWGDTITLPSALDLDNWTYIQISDGAIDAWNNSIIIDTVLSQTIDGYSSYTISSDSWSITIMVYDWNYIWTSM